MTVNSIIISCTILVFEGIFTKIPESQLTLFSHCRVFFFYTMSGKNRNKSFLLPKTDNIAIY